MSKYAPILFEPSASLPTVEVGRLTDCIECYVTEERNSIYELSMVVASTDKHYDDIKVNYMLAVDVDCSFEETGTPNIQYFDIVEVHKGTDNRATVHANHISYRLNYIPMMNYSATGINNIMSNIPTGCLVSNPFNFSARGWGSEADSLIFYSKSMKSVRQMLGGSESSLMDKIEATWVNDYYGEYEWDNLDVILWKKRNPVSGADKVLSYGKNITAFEHTEDSKNIFTGCIAYWTDVNGNNLVYGSVRYAGTPDASFKAPRIYMLDTSGDFDEAPTVQELTDAADTYLSTTKFGKLNTNTTTTFIDLNDVGEGLNIKMCNNVNVLYKPLGIVQYGLIVVRTVWDVLRHRMASIEVDNPRVTLAKTLAETIQSTDANTAQISAILMELARLKQSIVDAQDYADDAFVKIVGDTMTGALTAPSVDGTTGVTASNGNIIAGDESNTAERHLEVASGSGRIYLYATASGTGNRGIWVPAHGTGSAKAVMVVDTNNEASFRGNATSASNGRVTETNPTTSTNYYPLWTSNKVADTDYPFRANDGMRYSTVDGSSTQTTGQSILVLGNNIASGTDGNKRGYLRLYSSSTSFITLQSAATATNYAQTLQAKTGTIALLDDLPQRSTSSSAITRTSGGTIGTQQIVKYGNVITVYCSVTTTAATASAANFFVGSVSADYRPSYNVSGGSYIGSTAVGISLDSSGVLTVRNASAASRAAGTISFSLTYVV